VICAKCGKNVPKSEIHTVRLNGEIPVDYCEECVKLIKEQMKNYPKRKKP
jgi:hypothetical protein